ncbi:MAG TPA: restriction endonuclease, partial [Runella sp.]|nr:restriction endonuclease [Runella sp.]
TKFKQIIGRGTRVNEEHNKLYFTILDFRNATDLFADTQFDGDPIRIKPVAEETNLGSIIDEEEQNTDPIIDTETGEKIVLTPPQIRYPTTQEPPPTANEPRQKVYINGVDVSVLISRELHFEQNGQLITISLKDHTQKIIKGQFASLDDFLNKWQTSERKEVIIAELAERGVIIDALYEAVNKEVDLFDLICHVAYDQPPLTRMERANNVKKRNYFTKYGQQARQVLEALLEKYADQGIENIENIQILTIPPFNEFGTVTEIIKAFGSRIEYEKAVKELENELYKNIA